MHAYIGTFTREPAERQQIIHFEILLYWCLVWTAIRLRQIIRVSGSSVSLFHATYVYSFSQQRADGCLELQQQKGANVNVRNNRNYHNTFSFVYTLWLWRVKGGLVSLPPHIHPYGMTTGRKQKQPARFRVTCCCRLQQ